MSAREPLANDPVRTCRKCAQEKPLFAFSMAGQYRRHVCDECRKQRDAGVRYLRKNRISMAWPKRRSLRG